MFSSSLHLKEFQPMYAYKGYVYKKECNKWSISTICSLFSRLIYVKIIYITWQPFSSFYLKVFKRWSMWWWAFHLRVHCTNWNGNLCKVDGFVLSYASLQKYFLIFQPQVMFSSSLHLKEFQPMYAYKGYVYKKECNKWSISTICSLFSRLIYVKIIYITWQPFSSFYLKVFKRWSMWW